MGAGKDKKVLERHIFASIALTRNNRNILFAKVLSTFCALERAKQNVARSSSGSEISWWGILAQWGVLPHVTSTISHQSMAQFYRAGFCCITFLSNFALLSTYNTPTLELVDLCGWDQNLDTFTRQYVSLWPRHIQAISYCIDPSIPVDMSSLWVTCAQ